MKTLFNSAYKGKTVLVTGHNGFKGTWLSFWLSEMGAKVVGLSLADYPNQKHFQLIASGLNLREENGDIRNFEHVQRVIDRHQPDIVFHLAAQPLVRDSYADPRYTFETNILGTLNLLEAIRLNGKVPNLVNITTDKVYENKEWTWPYRENDRLWGHDPYSSSKVGSEVVTASYKKSFFQDGSVAIASGRAGNVIGGGDWSKDRLIPDMVRAIENNTILEIRSPGSVRPWQHVLDSISGYLQLGQRLMEGDSSAASEWNFGPAIESCVSVETMLNIFQKSQPIENVQYPQNTGAVHESKLLMLDCTKALRDLNWKPVWQLEKAVERTASWYRDWLNKKEVATGRDLESYVNDARSGGNAWTR